MTPPSYYDTLQITAKASQTEVKQAYRRLVKRFHPDQNPELDSHDQVAQINQAYEVLSDPETRRRYDRELVVTQQRSPRVAQRQRPRGQDLDQQLTRWHNGVFLPVSRLLDEILGSLDGQIDELAADPFDDQLMGKFQDYIHHCQQAYANAQNLFRTLPNPPNIAGAAACLYHCLNQLGDGLEELESFTLNYDDRHLHTGHELFRIAAGLYAEAAEALACLGR